MYPTRLSHAYVDGLEASTRANTDVQTRHPSFLLFSFRETIRELIKASNLSKNQFCVKAAATNDLAKVEMSHVGGCTFSRLAAFYPPPPLVRLNSAVQHDPAGAIIKSEPCKFAFAATTNRQTRDRHRDGRAVVRAVIRGPREVINGLTRCVTIQLQSGNVDFPELTVDKAGSNCHDRSSPTLSARLTATARQEHKYRTRARKSERS